MNQGSPVSRWRRYALGCLLASVLILVLVLVRGQTGWVAFLDIPHRMEALGRRGPLVFGLGYVCAVVLMVPGSALTLIAGALFGPVVGTLTVVAASNAGASVAFLIARYLARDAVARRLSRNPRFQAIDQAISTHGVLVVALLRLSPVVPFNVQNYLFGLTGVGFWTCTLTSAVAMLPGTILYVFLGLSARAGLEAASDGRHARTPAEWTLLVVGVLATLTLSVLATAWARRGLQKTISNPVNPSHENQNKWESEP